MATTYEYDAFISHAVEDKIAIANALNEALRARGLKIWYSGQELSVGDPLINTITEGLKRSRFGIIIVSPTYLTKIWALSELNHFLNSTNAKDKVILPVLLGITPEQFPPQLPKLADLFAIRAEKGPDVVADIIFRTIRDVQADEESTRRSIRRRWLLGGFVLILLAALLGYFLWTRDIADREQVEAMINARIDQASSLDGESLKLFKSDDTLSIAEAADIFTQYTNSKSYYRNEYRLKVSGKEIRAKKNVEAALGIDLDARTPLNSFGMDSVAIYVHHGEDDSGSKVERLIFKNLAPVRYEVEIESYGDDKLAAKVQYLNGIRLIDLKLSFPKSATDTKRFLADFRGLLPSETYQFVRKGGRLELEEVR
jgi:hypothetical protein